MDKGQILVRASMNYKKMKVALKIVLGKWVEKKSVAKIKASSLKLAKAVIAAKGVLDAHKKELLSTLVWKVTEANGKYDTRFISEGVYRGIQPVEHEHVIPREVLVNQMLGNPKKVKEILGSAIGCLVTKSEHEKLIKRKELRVAGWERYRSVKIRVYDRLKRRWL